MNCAEKLLEQTIFFNLYTKSLIKYKSKLWIFSNQNEFVSTK